MNQQMVPINRENDTRGSRRPSRLLVGLLAVVLLGLPAASVWAGPPPLNNSAGRQTFALIGDTPYGPEQTEAFPRLVADINQDPKVRFVLHAGDVKAGSTRCSDDLLQTKDRLYETFRDPFVLTPGDNGWTDCHRVGAGQYLPTERLAFFRELFYPAPGTTLGRRTMPVQTQAEEPADSDYVENQLFMRSRVVFSTVHVVGSNNNLAPGRVCPAATDRSCAGRRSGNAGPPTSPGWSTPSPPPTSRTPPGCWCSSRPTRGSSWPTTIPPRPGSSHS